MVGACHLVMVRAAHAYCKRPRRLRSAEFNPREEPQREEVTALGRQFRDRTCRELGQAGRLAAYWEENMGRNETYRRSADECLRWADPTLDANDRDALLRMADQWHQLAEQEEALRLRTMTSGGGRLRSAGERPPC